MRAVYCLCVLHCAVLGGCRGSTKPMAMPTVLSSPYSAGRDVVWAVAPLRNESGVSAIDTLALSDTLASEAEQTQGISVLPVNRTLAAMRALNLGTVRTTQEALSLCKALGADAILVGSVTAWKPYDPPVLGLSLGLFGEGVALKTSGSSGVRADELRSATTDQSPGSAMPAQPLSASAAVLDASNGDTRAQIRSYATGRHDPSSALGWERFTSSMGLYARFACHEMTRRLLEQEHSRLGVSSARMNQVPPP